MDSACNGQKGFELHYFISFASKSEQKTLRKKEAWDLKKMFLAGARHARIENIFCLHKRSF